MRFWQQVEACPDKLLTMLISFHQATERIKLMERTNLEHLFFEEASDALLAIELSNLTVLTMNPAFERLTGIKLDELKGESLSTLSPLSSGNQNTRLLNAEMILNSGFYSDVQLSTKEGFRYVTLKVRHAESRGQKIALCVISDDTERQLLVRDLAVKHQTLEAAHLELEKAHMELKISREKMIHASKMMSLGELASGMSHELNQPLTGVRGFSQEIIEELKNPKPSKKQVRRQAQLIVENADKMAKLLASLRDFARRGKNSSSEQSLSSENISLEKPLQSVKILLAKKLAQENIQLIEQIVTSQNFQGDSQSTEQILLNLITNASDSIREKRITNPSTVGRIVVQSEIRGSQLEIQISDNGNGIPPALQNRIFDPFFSTKSPGQGMGLGLSISYGLAHRMGGDLQLRHSNSQGTTFALTLPIATTSSSDPKMKKVA
jgi:PAS domain S-box-containing protein